MQTSRIVSIPLLERAIRKALKKINFKDREKIIEGFLQHVYVVRIKRIPYSLYELFSPFPITENHPEYNIPIDVHYDIGNKHYMLSATIYKGIKTTVFTFYEYTHFGDWDDEQRQFLTSFIWEHTYVNAPD